MRISHALYDTDNNIMKHQQHQSARGTNSALTAEIMFIKQG